MSHPAPSRLAALPGYDTAPDVYETPDLAEATDTTIGNQSSRSPSPSEDDSQTTPDEDGESDDDESASGVVSRRRTNLSKARRKFEKEGRGVRTKGVVLGDSIGGLRKGYGLRSVRYHGENEGLESRVARLRREVEECRMLAAEEAQKKKVKFEGDEDDAMGGEVEGLQALLANLNMEVEQRRKGPSTAKVTSRKDSTGTPGAWPDGGTDGDMTDEQTLQKVADFDSRLSGLETALGLSALDAVGGEEAAPLPLLPSLTLLDQQLSALSSASSFANIEAASARLQRLRQEANMLQLQTAGNGTTDGDSEAEITALSPADRESLMKLYSLLPTLHSLSPTVPALLTRLRSLRTLHTNAANAASALEDVEKRQDEMDRELKVWREGLERVEDVVGKAQEANGRNGKFVEGWVKDLEGRMQNLGR